MSQKGDKIFQQRRKEKSIKRILEEYKNIINTNLADIIMVNDSVDCFHIRFTPTGGHYRGQTLILELKPKHPTYSLPYPFSPPSIKLLTPVFHTNVSNSGSICVDFIYNAERWVPTYGFESIITAIILLFDEPEFTHGHYNLDASTLYRKCIDEKSFVDFDIRTRNYYKLMLQNEGQKILDAFDEIYKRQQPNRPPVGLGPIT